MINVFYSKNDLCLSQRKLIWEQENKKKGKKIFHISSYIMPYLCLI